MTNDEWAAANGWVKDANGQWVRTEPAPEKAPNCCGKSEPQKVKRDT